MKNTLRTTSASLLLPLLLLLALLAVSACCGARAAGGESFPVGAPVKLGDAGSSMLTRYVSAASFASGRSYVLYSPFDCTLEERYAANDSLVAPPFEPAGLKDAFPRGPPYRAMLFRSAADEDEVTLVFAAFVYRIGSRVGVANPPPDVPRNSSLSPYGFSTPVRLLAARSDGAVASGGCVYTRDLVRVNPCLAYTAKVPSSAGLAWRDLDAWPLLNGNALVTGSLETTYRYCPPTGAACSWYIWMGAGISQMDAAGTTYGGLSFSWASGKSGSSIPASRIPAYSPATTVSGNFAFSWMVTGRHGGPLALTSTLAANPHVSPVTVADSYDEVVMRPTEALSPGIVMCASSAHVLWLYSGAAVPGATDPPPAMRGGAAQFRGTNSTSAAGLELVAGSAMDFVASDPGQVLATVLGCECLGVRGHGEAALSDFLVAYSTATGAGDSRTESLSARRVTLGAPAALVPNLGQEDAPVGQAFSWTLPPHTFAAGMAVDDAGYLVGGGADGPPAAPVDGTLPGWLAWNQDARSLSGTPAKPDRGVARVRFRVTVGGRSAEAALNVSVPNAAPVPAAGFNASLLAPVGLCGGASVGSVAGAATDPDGDALAYALDPEGGPPAWLAVSAAGAATAAACVEGPARTFDVRVLVTDGFGGSVSVRVPVSVVPSLELDGLPPGGASTFTEDTDVASVLGGGVVLRSLLPGGTPRVDASAALRPGSVGRLLAGAGGTVPADGRSWNVSGTSGEVQAALRGLGFRPAKNSDADATVAGSVSAPGSAAPLEFSVLLTAVPVNDPPAGVQDAMPGTPVEVPTGGTLLVPVPDAAFTDVDSPPPALSLGPGAPAWLAIDRRAVRGVPPRGTRRAEPYTVAVVGTDDGGLTASVSLRVRVVNAAPVAAAGARTSLVTVPGRPVRIEMRAADLFEDADGDDVTLRLSETGVPPFLAAAGDGTGVVVLSGTAGDAHVGMSWKSHLVASDGHGGAGEANLTVWVDRGPAVTGLRDGQHVEYRAGAVVLFRSLGVSVNGPDATLSVVIKLSRAIAGEISTPARGTARPRWLGAVGEWSARNCTPEDASAALADSVFTPSDGFTDDVVMTFTVSDEHTETASVSVVFKSAGGGGGGGADGGSSSSTPVYAATVVGGAVLSGLVGCIFWQARKRRETKAARQRHRLGSRLRELLRLDVGSFESDSGLEYVGAVDAVAEALRAGHSMAVSQMTSPMMDVLAGCVASAVTEMRLVYPVRRAGPCFGGDRQHLDAANVLSERVALAARAAELYAEADARGEVAAAQERYLRARTDRSSSGALGGGAGGGGKEQLEEPLLMGVDPDDQL